MSNSFSSYFIPCKLGPNYKHRWISSLGGKNWPTVAGTIPQDTVLHLVPEVPREIIYTIYWLNRVSGVLHTLSFALWQANHAESIYIFSGDKRHTESLSTGVDGMDYGDRHSHTLSYYGTDLGQVFLFFFFNLPLVLVCSPVKGNNNVSFFHTRIVFSCVYWIIVVAQWQTLFQKLPDTQDFYPSFYFMKRWQ